MKLKAAAVGVAQGNGHVEEPLLVQELLALHAIHKAWKDHVILDDLELVLDRGTLTSVTGTNGIGKTTMMRIAVGLIRPDAGIVDLDGLHPVHDRREFQERTGFLAAGDRGLYARLTVRQHLDLWGKICLLSRDERREAMERVIDGMELGDLADHRADRMSMGQRQRLRIAMVFMHDPEVVFLDEPLNSLDQNGAELLGGELDRLKKRGGAALWCSPGTESHSIPVDVELRLESGRLVDGRQ
jgi:ABC-2 type transport system ATP-binding protein